MADKPLTAQDILAGKGPFVGQELKPYDDPTWSGQIGHKFEQGASGLGAGPAVTASAGEIGNTIGGILGSMSLHDAIPNLVEAYHRFRYGQPVQGAMSVLSALPMTPGAGVGRTVAKDVVENVAKDAVENAAARNMTQVPSIRGVPVDQAIEMARSEPHLIPAGQGSRSGFVGGPPDIQTMDDLTARRAEFDKYVGADPRGWDWYDRYRAGMNRATGGDEDLNAWMSPMQGSWSQGVNPQSELGYVLKEGNSALAGAPTRANYQTQHDAFQRAIESGDPWQMQLGDKTEQYAQLVNPDQPPNAGAVGVNDFRYANQWGYRPEDLETRAGKVSLTAPQHQFLDYETALAVDRANQLGLGGRTDWTGEQLQAAPWVRQKALALSDPTDPKTPLAFRGNYDAAFQEANKTAPDFFEKHAANATWEAQPGVSIPEHFPGSSTATPEERQAYMDAPGSWAAAPSMGLEAGETPRDAIYGGLRLYNSNNVPTTGMYTLPSRPMTGVFEGQNNPGMVARPLVAFDTAGNVKTVPAADQALLNAGETVRSGFGAQDAGAWNKTWRADKLGAANSYFQPLDRPATVEELNAARVAGEGYGMPMSADTGGGILTTNFGEPQGWKPAERKAAVASMEAAAPADTTGAGQLMKTDSGYIDLTPEWKQGVGSGAVTQKMLDALGATPEMREAFNQNPFIPEVVRAQAERDAALAPASWGAPRPDIQNLRLVAGEGPGWVDRLQAGLETFKKTGRLPALAAGGAGGAAVFTPTAGFPSQLDPQTAPPPPPPPIGSSSQYDDWWKALQGG